jgi:outer membrane protein assembly factor BamB
LVIGDQVIAATEHNTVYALAAADGHVMWSASLGQPVPGSDLPCGNIDPLGITGTPAYDATTGNVFVVTETAGARHTLHALDVRTGRDRWHRSMDVAGGRDRSAEQQRAALLVTDGRVYVAFGGLFGDCGNYVGYVAAVSTNGTGSTLTYEIPTAREAGMWAPPGPVVGPGGDLYVASGNGAETGGHYDGSDSVVRLTPKLHEVALFAPSTWAADNAQDLDLGSSSPVPVAGQIVIAGKRGSVYLLSSALGGVGAQRATLDGCPAYGGAATRGAMVVLPCNGGIRALRVVGHRMHWVWSTPGLGGSPVMAGPHVFALDQDAGDLVAVAAGTGHEQWRAHVGEVSRFATPALHERYIYVGTTRGVVALRGAA